MRNLSATASAVNVIVHLERARFGIGGQRALESSQSLSLAPQEETQLVFALSQATLGGDQRIGVYPRIEHPHDGRAINNAGAQVVFGALTSDVGRQPEFNFPVRNEHPYAQRIDLAVLANDLSGIVSPASRVFGPFEEIQASLRLTAPPGLPGAGGVARREATVVARSATGDLLGGLTYLLFVDV